MLHSMGLPIRNLEMDGRAVAVPRLRPDPAAVSGHDPPADFDPHRGTLGHDPRAPGSCRALRWKLPPRFRDAGTVVRHRKERALLRPGEGDGHGAARARPPGGAREDVSQNLHDRGRVDPALQRLARSHFERESPRLEERAHFLDDTGDDALDRSGVEAKDALPLLEAGEVDEIVE